MDVKWAPVPTLEDKYEVSSDGQVRSIRFDRILKSSPARGQRVVSIPTPIGTKVYEVRHLIAYAFLGADITSTTKPKLIHKDGDLNNIHLSNLELADYSDLDAEEWRDIQGFEGVYQVSNLGRVKRVSRVDTYTRSDTHKVCERRVADKILKPAVTQDYYEVNLVRGDSSQYRRVHRIVAEAFIPNPFNLPQINHIDGNKENNEVSNLEWCTSRENVAHASQTGLRKSPRKGVYRSPVKIKCIETGQVFSNKKLAADELGLSYSYLCDCIGQRKPCNGYTFEVLTERS